MSASPRFRALAGPPAAIVARCRPLLWRAAAEARKAEELRRGGAGDPDQKRDRDCDRDQRAGLGEHAQEGLWLRHQSSVEMDFEDNAILAESGRKRAYFPAWIGHPPRPSKWRLNSCI
jgi:hypothetical protein